jgi:uncharacterized protein YprB with RNaseH-like and TPR domain
MTIATSASLLSIVRSMYKSMTLADLRSHTHNFFHHLTELYTKHKHQNLTSFLKQFLSDEQVRVYFFEQNKPTFRCYRTDSWYRFVDEKERIETYLDSHDITTLHNLLKDSRAIKDHKQQKSVLDGLLENFYAWQWTHIHWKPFVVYDIETTFYGSHITDQHFEMAYSVDSSTVQDHWCTYVYSDAHSSKQLCDFLLSYDGYIVWYNHISFDNPVLVHNAWYGPPELAILNEKSIDPFLFLWKLTGKRMSLNNVAQALIATWKTLSSWKEWEQLLKEWKKTWNSRVLETVKKYCKNDVEITLWVFLYLLTYSSIQVDDTPYSFTLETLMSLWMRQSNSDQDSFTNGSLFLD